MEEKVVTIVTAFFDIGRKDFKDVARSNDVYFEYFKFWGKIKNNIIIYTDSVMAEKVRKFREEIGLINSTKIIIVDDISTIEPEILDNLVKVSKSQTFLKYRYMPNLADNNPLYDYVMLLKAWCLKDVAQNGYADGLLAWIDFGFNHGGDVFNNSEEFNFKLKVKLPEDKITLFAFKEDDNKPIFQVVQSYEVYIMGAPMYVPTKFADTFWTDIKKSIESLIDVGFMDDDQTLLLMAYRKNSEIYNIIKSNWFMPLKEYGGEHLSYNLKTRKLRYKDRILQRYRVMKRNLKCMKNLKEIFIKSREDI